MPSTPFHLGPAMFFGLLLFKYVDFPTFLVANVIVDLEPFLVLLFGLDYPLHGFFHSFLGGSVLSLALALVMTRLRKPVSEIMNAFKIKQEFSPRKVWLASFSGVCLHILMDSFLYADMKPLYPFDSNPFLISSVFAGFWMYGFCVLCFLAGFVLYFRIFYESTRENQQTS